jgi:3-oxoadipate enol-lactonase
MNNVKLSHSSIAYSRHGQGKPLVLLHGYPLDHRIWDDLIPYLEMDFDILLPDLRGFGQSTANENGYTLSDMAEDIAELLQHLELPKAVIVGHSMGGYVSLAFARSFPENIFGLGLVASQAIADSPDRRESRYKDIKQVELSGVDYIAKNMPGKLTSSPQIQESLYGIIMSQPEAGIKNALGALAERPDQTSLLGRIIVPISIVHGNLDKLIPVERAFEMNKLVPLSKLIVIDNAGHMPMLESPEKTASAIRWLI